MPNGTDGALKKKWYIYKGVFYPKHLVKKMPKTVTHYEDESSAPVLFKADWWERSPKKSKILTGWRPGTKV